jgi:hypothetical protein
MNKQIFKVTKPNKNKNGNKNKNDNTLGKIISATIIARTSLKVSLHSSDITFNGNKYLNVYEALASSDDFIELQQDYDFIKVKDFTLSVRRCGSDITIQEVGLVNRTVYIGYYPKYTDLTDSSLPLRQANALVIPSLSLGSHSRLYKSQDMMVRGLRDSLPVWINPKNYMDTDNLPFAPGCLVVGWDNGTAALANGFLYDIELRFNVQFACPR